jgi:hypothetical protein
MFFTDVYHVSDKTKGNTRNFEYPETTTGSKAAKKLRSEANGLSDLQRQDLFEKGMQIIYGGNGKKTIGVGR